MTPTNTCSLIIAYSLFIFSSHGTYAVMSEMDFKISWLRWWVCKLYLIDQILPTACSGMAHNSELRIVFTFLNVLKSKKELKFHVMQKLYEIQISLSINKVPERTHVFSLTYCL